MLITKTCIFDGTTHTLDLNVTQEQLDRWSKGGLVQNVFPHLSSDEREFLMTGIVPGDWEKWVGREE